MISSIIVFGVSLAWLILLIGVRAFELKTGKALVPRKIRSGLDRLFRSIACFFVKLSRAIGLGIISVLGNIFGSVYTQMKRIIIFCEKKVQKFYRSITGKVDVKKGNGSEYIESVSKHREEMMEKREPVAK